MLTFSFRYRNGWLLALLLLICQLSISQTLSTKELVNQAKTKIDLKPQKDTPLQLNTQLVLDKQIFGAASSSVGLKLDPTAFGQLAAKKQDFLQMNIPIGLDEQLELELVPSDIFAPGFKVTTQSSSGTKQEVDFDRGMHWQGVVKGADKSFVALSWLDGELTGLISDGKGQNRVLSKLSKVGVSQDYVLFVDNTYNQKRTFECGALSTPASNAPRTSGAIAQESILCKVVDIYFEVDNDMYTKLGANTTTVSNYVAALFNQVATLYRNENLAVRISGLNIWATPDPYVGLTSTGSVLTAFQNNLNGTTNPNTGNPTFPGRLAHFLSTRSLGGGIAYLDVLCTKIYGYGVSASLGTSFPEVPSYSWDVMVITHELGHNFGSEHTQSCSWPGGAIDNCYTTEGGCPPGPAPVNGGTIMSYCHLTSTGINLANGFGPLPGNLIRSRVQNSNCLATSSAVPSNLTTSNIFRSTAQLNWSETGSNSTFTVNYRQQGSSTWIPLTTTATKYSLSGLLPLTAYEWQVKGDCSAFSGIINFTTTNVEPPVCTPGVTDCTDSDVITKVMLATINNSSGCSANGYGDYRSSLAAPTLVKGTSYSFSVSKPTAFSDAVQVWIDYNQNGVFETTEKVVEFASNRTATQTSPIVIPTSAATGIAVMRVRLRYDALPGDPCAAYTYGETEDYSLNITDVVTCSTTASSNSPLCQGNTLNLSATGSGTFAWAGPNSFSATGANPVLSNVNSANSGTYTVTLSSGTCTATATANVTVNTTPTASVAGTTAYCTGQTISLTASGGTTYNWAGPSGFVSTSATISRASATTAMSGIYTVTAANGSCTATATANVTVSATPTATVAGATSYCSGQTISLTASGGTSYSWAGPNSFSSASANVSIPSATSANAGVYTVTAANGNCTATATVSVGVGNAATASIAGTTAYCTGQTISLTASGGTTYNWAGPSGFVSTSATISRASATTAMSGTYSVTVANGACTATATANVTVSTTPTATVAGATSYCSGQTISLTASGGTSYSWAGPNSFSSTSANVSIPSATSSEAGVYTVTAANGSCTATATVSVGVGNAATASVAGTTAYCTGQTISLTASGGTTYNWAGPSGFVSTSATISRASATTAMSGTYSVTVANGPCTATATANVTVSATPAATIAGATSYCSGQTISLTASGGTSFSWAGPNSFSSTSVNISLSSATSSEAGVYTVTAANDNCTATATVSVSVGNAATASVAGTTAYCTGQTISLTASGGTTYNWAGPSSFVSTSATISRASATTAMSGTYSVTVANGACTATATANVTVSATPTATVAGATSYCSGQTISLTANGGTSYSWAGPNSFSSTSANVSIPSATSANAGVYTVTVANGNCTATATVSVSVGNAATASVAGTTAYCTGQTISLTASGGTTYNWAGPSGFVSTSATISRASATTAMSGTYSVTVANGACTATATANVTVSATPTATTAGATSYCSGQTISLTASGGTSYSWAGPNSFSSTSANVSIPSATSANAGVYTVTAANGICTATATVSVGVGNAATASVAGTTAYCTGQTISLTASGGTTYNWAGPSSFASTSATISRASATTAMSGTYSVTVANGSCTATATANVTVSATPTATIAGATSYCSGQTISLTASGGTSFSWVGPNSFSSTSANVSIPSATSANAGVYTVTAANGICTATATVSVTINNSPNVTINGATSYCTSQTISLTASGGGTYSWRGPGTFSSTSATISRTSATTAMAGGYTVTVTNGACTTSASVSVAVVVASVVAGQTNGSLICTGQTLSLTATGGHPQYSWAGPASFSSTQQNPQRPNLTTAMSGRYSVSATAICGVRVTSTVQVTVRASPAATITSNSPVCVGTTLRLTASSGAGYTWNGPNSFTSNVQRPTIAATTLVNGGVYSLTVRATNSCVSSNTASIVVQNCSGARIAAEAEVPAMGISLNVSPNPASNRLVVEVRLSVVQPVSLKLLNAQGYTQRTVELTEEALYHRAELDINDIAEGVYLISAQSGKERVTKRVVKIN